MKVLIQNCLTHRFLGKGDKWYKSPDKARDFGSGEKAIAHYIKHRLKDAQIVLHFHRTPGQDIDLPLSETCKKRSRRKRSS